MFQQTTTIKAVGIESGIVNSRAASATYVIQIPNTVPAIASGPLATPNPAKAGKLGAAK
jgi:hypothetical protein